jgi:tetratricopeptide (TPR) repeat protein
MSETLKESLERIAAKSTAERPAEAVAAYEALLVKFPGNASVLCPLAQWALAAGDVARAEQAYRAAIAKRPQFGLAHAGLGDVLYRQGQMQAALDAYRLAREARNDRAPEKVVERMIAELEKLTQPAAAPAARPGKAQVRAEAKAPAAKAGRGDGDGDTKKTSARNRELEDKARQASELLDAGSFREAAAMLDELVAAGHCTRRVYGRLGTAKSKIGDFAGSEDAFREAIRLEPDSGRSYLGLGRALASQEKWQAAEQALRRAVTIDSKNQLFRDELHEFLRTRPKSAAPELPPRRVAAATPAPAPAQPARPAPPPAAIETPLPKTIDEHRRELQAFREFLDLVAKS